jgi:hypothetical protein
MDKRKILLAVFISFSLLVCPFARADETALFTTVAPDALIVLDLSASMNLAPAGSSMFIASTQQCGTDGPFYAFSGPSHDKACSISIDAVPKYGDAACSGPFYRTAAGDHVTDCSRLAIAKRALFDVLDDDDGGTINSQDETSMNVRVGYMRFYNCTANETDGNYSGGCNSLIKPIGTKFSYIYCNNSTSCTAITPVGTPGITPGIINELAKGWTPLATALNEAKLYYDVQKAADKAKECRQKFVILITDGEDTLACGGDGSSTQTDQYKRRRESVAKAKALADAGYKVFVVGFGADMPHYLQNTLNWMAYHGQTDNPLAANLGGTSTYNSTAVTPCTDSPYCSHTVGVDTHYYACVNSTSDPTPLHDPGELNLSGYAFIATSAGEIKDAIRTAMNVIREATYSFSQASVASSRLMDENYLYEGSFQPINNDPFWLGHLKKYTINADGTVGGLLWDAGEILKNQSAGNRNMFTMLGGAKANFTTSISASTLGASSDAERDAIVGYIRGEDSYNPENWKLGDVFRATPINIGTPSLYYFDIRDENDAFDTFRANHPRTTANGLRVVVTGANDGQLHGFRTDDGQEVWSFVPPNLLKKLKNIAHSTHPTSLIHQYFVDGPVTVADVWLGSGDGKYKYPSDWKTILITAEGRGGSSHLWSSSPNCDSDCATTFNATTSPFYCGFYAFNVTDSMNPIYMWHLNPTSAQAPYFGDPWSKFYVGRVKVGGQEKWVGFIGGGYNGSDCSGGGKCDTRGKGFFVVDLQNGNILWSYTMADNAGMAYSVPASPAIADTDNDNFIDTAYIGDLGGNVWRFKFCSASDAEYCSYGNWQGGKLFDSSTGVIRPIYMTPAVTLDQRKRVWVYFGTGDKMDPTAANAQEKFYAVKDSDLTTTYTINNLENITTSTYTDASNKHGWYINLAGSGEKILADPAVFGNVAYFTTYTPPAGGDPCSQAGTASLYAVNYVSGGGILAGGRSMSLGVGVPTAPVLSFKPGGGSSPDLYVTVSGGSGTNASTIRAPMNPPTLANRANILYWRDRRLQ